MTVGLIFLCAAVLALLLTGWLRRYALTRRLMDIPNERSSHTVPTPRGCGGGSGSTRSIAAMPINMPPADTAPIRRCPWPSGPSILPVAALVAVGRLDGVLGVVMAYAPLVWLAVRFKAGAREWQEV